MKFKGEYEGVRDRENQHEYSRSEERGRLHEV